MSYLELWGDCHTHSHWSDGFDSIAELSAFQAKLGFDFRIQTDHCGVRMPEGTYIRKEHVAEKGHLLTPENFARYLDGCKAASAGGHIVLPGIELDLDYGYRALNVKNNYCHILAYGFTEAAQLPPDGWYASKGLFEVMAGLRERGLRVGLAHVNDDECHLPWQELSDQFDFFEVNHSSYSEPVPPFEQGVLRFGFWDKWLCSGLKISVSTGSDCHQADMSGFAMRNVVMVDELSEGAILGSLANGRSYLSSTWHPDIYSECGLPRSYWFKHVQGNDRNAARPLLERVRGAMSAGDYGRVLRTDYPLLDFRLEGGRMGESVKISGLAQAALKVDMHVPIASIDIIAGGSLLKRICPGTAHFEGSVTLDGLDGRRYVRIQVEGSDSKGRKEWLVSNPVYLRGS